MIRLTDEEINKVHNGEINGDDERLCKAQLKKVVEELLVYSVGCEERYEPIVKKWGQNEKVYMRCFNVPESVWQALLEEVK